jgi:hypothetical protein
VSVNESIEALDSLVSGSRWYCEASYPSYVAEAERTPNADEPAKKGEATEARARCILLTLSVHSSVSGRCFFSLPRFACPRTALAKPPTHTPRRRWRSSASWRAKPAPHGHLYSLLPVWTFAWRFRSCCLTKHLPHPLHLYCRSPRCVWICE